LLNSLTACLLVDLEAGRIGAYRRRLDKV